MASIRSGRLRLVIYANDHPPAHTHVLGAGWEIRVGLSDPPGLLTIVGRPKAAEVAAAVMATAAHLDALRALWRRLHD